jgi:hypothetical protein
MLFWNKSGYSYYQLLVLRIVAKAQSSLVLKEWKMDRAIPLG